MTSFSPADRSGLRAAKLWQRASFALHFALLLSAMLTSSRDFDDSATAGVLVSLVAVPKSLPDVADSINSAKSKVESILAAQGYKGYLVEVASRSELQVTLLDGRTAVGKPDELDHAICRASEMGISLEEAFADAGFLDGIG